MTKAIEPKTELDNLIEAFGEDQDLFLFYLKWIECGLNSGKAYKELHPEVTKHSARTLGSRLLSKVDKREVMRAYGLDLDVYYNQLKAGLKATKRDHFSGEIEDDHKTRLGYHDKLGKQLGVESDSPNLIQVNVTPILSELKAE